jgi:hypothetical protein
LNGTFGEMAAASVSGPFVGCKSPDASMSEVAEMAFLHVGGTCFYGLLHICQSTAEERTRIRTIKNRRLVVLLQVQRNIGQII